MSCEAEEQHLPAGLEERLLQRELGVGGVRVDVLSLEVVSSEADVDAKLRAHFGEVDASLQEVHLVIVCNAATVPGSLIHSVMFRCREQREEYTKTRKSSVRRNVVLLLCTFSCAGFQPLSTERLMQHPTSTSTSTMLGTGSPLTRSSIMGLSSICGTLSVHF